MAASEHEAAATAQARQKAMLADAKTAMQRAEACGSVAEKLATSAAHSALEAQRVTGLRPMVLGRGRGRGSWRGRSRGGRG